MHKWIKYDDSIMKVYDIKLISLVYIKRNIKTIWAFSQKESLGNLYHASQISQSQIIYVSYQHSFYLRILSARAQHNTNRLIIKRELCKMMSRRWIFVVIVVVGLNKAKFKIKRKFFNWIGKIKKPTVHSLIC